MKKSFIVLLCLLLALYSSIAVFAHPGGTDGSGGHSDRDTGEYHYHHGYPAHDHYDMDGDGVVDCPYDFDDQTGKNSGSVDNNSSGSFWDDRSESDDIYWDEPTEPATAIIAPVNTEEEAKTVPAWAYWIMSILAIATVFLFLSNKRKSEEIHDLNRKHEDFILNESKRLDRELGDFNLDIVNRYGEFYLYSICDTPLGDHLGSDDLPATRVIDTHKWGEKYTFYIASPLFDGSASKKYHRRSCRYANHLHPVNAYIIRHGRFRYEPCAICRPVVPNVEWVTKYLIRKRFLEEHGISVTQVMPEFHTKDNPHLGEITLDRLEEFAIDMGVSVDTALSIINLQRENAGISHIRMEDLLVPTE